MQGEEYSDEKVFTLTGKESVHITIEIEGKIVNILTDSGSSINVMDKNTRSIHCILHKLSRKLLQLFIHMAVRHLSN